MKKSNTLNPLIHKRLHEKALPYLLLLPATVSFGLFTFWPFFRSVFLTLTITDATGDPVKWVGLGNFKRIFDQTSFWNIMNNTYIFALIVGAGTFFIALFLAYLSIEERKGCRIYQTMYSLTMAIASAPAAAIGWLLFKKSGLLNQLLGTSTDWLITESTALYCVAALTVWLRIGASYLFLLVGFRAVPNELIEAAKLDGAGPVRRLFRIICPVASPQIFFVVFLNITGSFKAFGQIKMLTGGGPAGASETLIYSIYKNGIVSGRFETGCVYALILFLVIFLTTRIQFLLEKRLVHYQ